MTHDAVAHLIAASAADDAALDTALRRAGVDAVTAILLDELLDRANLADVARLARPGRPARVEVRFPPVNAVIEIRDGAVRMAHTGIDEPSVVIAQDLREVCRAVFGPPEAVRAATRTVRYATSELAAEDAPGAPVFALTQRLLAALDRRDRPGLDELATRHGCDKFGLHQHTRHYERHFGPLRDHRLTVLEIGVGGYGVTDAGGGSLRMWRTYFPRARVYGLDMWDKSALDGCRVTTLRADQSDPRALADATDGIDGFDIIIDDGSHVSEHVLTTFHALFPKLRPGGIYAVEDVQTSYWPLFGGNGRDVDDPSTSVGFLKGCVDGLNHAELLATHDRPPRDTDDQIAGVHFYRNLVLLEKAVNREQSPFAEKLNAELVAVPTT